MINERERWREREREKEREMDVDFTSAGMCTAEACTFQECVAVENSHI